MSHTAGHQQSTLILVRLPVAAAHSVFPGNVRAVWGAHTLRPSGLHLANLAGAAFDSLACFCKSTVSGFLCEHFNSVSVMLPYQQIYRHQVIGGHFHTKQVGDLGFSPNIIFTLHNIYINHISLLTVTHRGVSPGGMRGRRVFITDLCVWLCTDWAELLQRNRGALRYTEFKWLSETFRG